jgi:membrane-associated phospholipid phosphatase
MRASAIISVLLYRLVINAPAYIRLLAMGAGIGFGILISISRIMVHAHSVSEVVTGFCLDAVVSATFLWRLTHTAPRACYEPVVNKETVLLSMRQAKAT